MGVMDVFGVGKRKVDYLASTLDIGVTPWSDQGNLSSIVWSDILGEDVVSNLPLTRAEAISIPAVSKARNLLVATIQRLPLRAVRNGVPIPKQPAWMTKTGNAVTPEERMAWTVDDLIFHGYSLWTVERGADGFPLSAEYVPMVSWKITDGHILIDDEPVADNKVILFNSPFEGLLNVATRSLRGAIAVEASWIGRAKNPLPLVDLHLTEDAQMEPEEVAQLVADWSKARNSPNGAIGSTPSNVELKVLGAIDADFMIEARNAIRTDVGSFVNIRAAMLDGTIGIDSLTYSTTEGQKNSFYEFDVPFWTTPIAARLSMDDVVPAGQTVRFDFSDAYASLPNPTGPATED